MSPEPAEDSDDPRGVCDCQPIIRAPVRFAGNIEKRHVDRFTRRIRAKKIAAISAQPQAGRRAETGELVILSNTRNFEIIDDRYRINDLNLEVGPTLPARIG